MSHEIDMSNDRANIAWTGSRSQIWHGLGQELSENASIDTWKKEAGLDWEIFQSKVMYQTIDGVQFFDDKNVLFRSDTQKPLSVVSSNYAVVQPSQILEFFRDLTELHGFKLSAAGSLFGGKRVWATAEMGKTYNSSVGDEVKGYLLLATSSDSSISTIGKIISTRVVCNNTLTVALNEHTKNVVKKTHASPWNAQETKLELGLIDEAWEKFSANITKLANVEVSDKFVQDYMVSKFYNKELDAADQSTQTYNKVAKMLSLYKTGAGADLSGSTAWGVLNAFTNASSHGLREKHDASRRFWDGTFGSGDAMNAEVYSDMLALAA